MRRFFETARRHGSEWTLAALFAAPVVMGILWLYHRVGIERDGGEPLGPLFRIAITTVAIGLVLGYLYENLSEPVRSWRERKARLSKRAEGELKPPSEE